MESNSKFPSRPLKSDYDLHQYFVFIHLKTFPQETVEPLTSACLDIVLVLLFFFNTTAAPNGSVAFSPCSSG